MKQFHLKSLLIFSFCLLFTCFSFAKSISLLNIPYQYSGQYIDQESQLQYLNARYYEPDLMRFINRDTFQQLNRYNYADDNPIMNQDPSGHSAIQVIGAIGAGMGAINAVLSLNNIGSYGGPEGDWYHDGPCCPTDSVSLLYYSENLLALFSMATGVAAVVKDSAPLAAVSMVSGTVALLMKAGQVIAFKGGIGRWADLYDNEGYDRYGYDVNGRDRERFNLFGINRVGQNIRGFDINGNYIDYGVDLDRGAVYFKINRQHDDQGYTWDYYPHSGRPGRKIVYLSDMIETNTENISTEFYDINLLRHVQEFDYGQARGYWVRPPALAGRNYANIVSEPMQEDDSENAPLIPARMSTNG